jgi:hypothetical protein
VVSIQFSYESPSKCRCSPPSKNLVSCSLLTSWFYSLNCLSCGNVIYGTSCLCSFGCLSCGDVIYGTSTVCLATYTIVGTTCTIVGTTNGSILPLINFCALTSVLFCSLFTFKLETPPSSTLFFLLKNFLESLL